MPTYIIGHKKPDLDATVAAMALEYLYQHESCFGYSNAKALLADPINPETEFVLHRFAAQAPVLISQVKLSPKVQIVLVDHNEPSQRAEAISPNQIVEIVDHHKPNFNFNRPIFVTIKPWGASTTIVWWLMQTCQLTPPKQLAQLMVSAILSDTVGLKSSTTTPVDKQALQELAQIGQINNTTGLAVEIFQAKSNLKGLSPREKVTNDFKIFDFKGQRLFINQIETVQQEAVLKELNQLMQAMQEVKEEYKVNWVYLVVSDILKVNSKLVYLTSSAKKLAQQAFPNATEVGQHILDIGTRISRKKEIAPAFEKIL